MKKLMKERLKELSADPKKALGQNFLINEGLCKKMVQYCKDIESEFYIEVGPGLGALTDGLIFNNLNLTLIEFDDVFSKYWESREQKVINQDALLFDWAQDLIPENSMLVSNLPYQISSTLVIKLSTLNTNILNMLLMFQREVAQRILAKPHTKSYGLLSVISQLFWEIDNFSLVGKGSFYPSPKVDSQVLSFKSTNLEIDNKKRKQLLSFLKFCFLQRRKILFNRIKKNYGADVAEKIEQWYKIKNYDLKLRPENLSVDDFYELFLVIHAENKI